MGNTLPSISLPQSGDGLGNFGTIYDSFGNPVNVNETAFNLAKEGQKNISTQNAFSLDSMSNKAAADANKTFGIDNNIFNLGLGAAQLGLGYMQYKDNHAMNEKTMEGMDQNLANAKTEAAATQAYRAAYKA